MSKRQPPLSVKLIAGLLVSSTDLIAEVHRLLAESFGPLADQTEPVPWTVSRYYEPEMGADLWRQFLAFSRPIEAGDLAAIKLRANALEDRWREARGRRVNIDPGYVAPLKLVLATTKDAAHRIYLADGIHAEVTLMYERGTFRALAHTYPDYAEEETIAFFNRVRRAAKSEG